jgi:hypothetical protein
VFRTYRKVACPGLPGVIPELTVIVEAVVASGGGKRLGLAAADSIPDRRLLADLPVFCRRHLPETVERDLIGAWLEP